MTTTYVNEQERMTVALVYDTNGTPKVRQTGGIQSITRSGSVATVTRPSHGYVNGQTVTIAGADQTDYNGDFTITVTGVDTFTYSLGGATPATPATGYLTLAHTEQSRWMVAPKALQVESIAAATTVKIEAAVRLSLGWTQIGADLTNADNGKLITLSQMYNYVRLRRSAGTGAVKVYAQQ